ncbi:hypothetical protein [Streptacidiphilus monticola]|uniref:Uncharacterized protein n=1 Tax=Streptacidiphilus monticola TaxID=2161674 RepID=A0ABW1GAE5_9ACTN
MTEQTSDRGSSKHGPALDDEMAHEVEGQVRSGQPSRAEEWHDPEPPVDREEDSSGAGTEPGSEGGSQAGTDPAAESLESEPERTPGYDVEAEQADQRAQGERDARAEQEAEEAMRPRSDQLPE